MLYVIICYTYCTSGWVALANGLSALSHCNIFHIWVSVICDPNKLSETWVASRNASHSHSDRDTLCHEPLYKHVTNWHELHHVMHHTHTHLSCITQCITLTLTWVASRNASHSHSDRDTLCHEPLYKHVTNSHELHHVMHYTHTHYKGRRHATATADNITANP